MSEPELRPTLTQPIRLDEPLRPRLSETLGVPCARFDPAAVHHIGVFIGEGVGAEVVPVAMRLLDLLGANSDRRFEFLRELRIVSKIYKWHCASGICQLYPDREGCLGVAGGSGSWQRSVEKRTPPNFPRNQLALASQGIDKTRMYLSDVWR